MTPKKLKHRPGLDLTPLEQKVIYWDPADAFKEIDHLIDHYERRQTTYQGVVFPQFDPTLCACGCGQKLTGRRTRWASDECRDWTYYVVQIICGDPQVIAHFLRRYYGWACAMCGEGDETNQIPMDVDHILPVHLGGGGLWLNNYQLLCKPCHKKKSRWESINRTKKRRKEAIRKKGILSLFE